MSSLSYPWAHLYYYVRSFPVSFLLLGVAATSTAGEVANAGERDRARILFALIILDFAMLGILNLPVRSRHLLVFWPAFILLVGIGIGRVHWYVARSYRGLVPRVTVAVLVFGLLTEHAISSLANPLILTTASPSAYRLPRVYPELWSGPLSLIPVDAVVISNDELACMYHVGRIDFWLASDRTDLAQFALAIDGVTYGLYGGGRQIASLDGAASQEMLSVRGRTPTVVVLFNTGRFAFSPYREMAMRVAEAQANAAIREAPGIFVLRIG